MFDMGPADGHFDLPPIVTQRRRRREEPRLYLGFERLGRDSSDTPNRIEGCFERWSRAPHVPTLQKPVLSNGFKYRDSSRFAMWLLRLDGSAWREEGLLNQFGLLLLREFYRPALYVEFGDRKEWIPRQAMVD